jgi:endonuclease G, mitochondrial
MNFGWQNLRWRLAKTMGFGFLYRFKQTLWQILRRADPPRSPFVRGMPEAGGFDLSRLPIKLVLTGSILLLSSCTLLDPNAVGKDSPHLLLGKPSPATVFNANDYLIVRPQYALSYNRSKGIANWASWQLNQAWLGDLPRPEFEPDLSLPQGWYQVKTSDYTGSGFDRGHIIPAADRNKTAADSKSVFLMTNILPQAPDNNQGPWERLESYCRLLARQGKELYVVAGSAGIGGTGMKGKRTVLANGAVTIPASLWKIVVVLDRPGLTLDSITETTPIIAVLMPNQQGIKETNWTSYRTSIDAIEQLTGYDFLSNVAEPIQASLEAKPALAAQPLFLKVNNQQGKIQ